MAFGNGDRKGVRAERLEQRLSGRNTQHAQSALNHLRQRRARMIRDMAFDGKFKLTGAAFDAKIDEHARSLFYIDHAIASITAEASDFVGAS